MSFLRVVVEISALFCCYADAETAMAQPLEVFVLILDSQLSIASEQTPGSSQEGGHPVPGVAASRLFQPRGDTGGRE